MAPVEHRLFFALRIAPVRGLVGGVRDGLGPAPSIVPDSRLHITLGITNDYPDLPPAVVDRLLAIAGTIAAAPVPVRLDQLSGDGKTIALRPSRRIKPLTTLTAALHRRMAAAELLRAAWRRRPHVTLLYRTGAPFTRAIDPICWTATEFVLIHSIIGAHRHVELGRWPLVERQSSFAF